MQSEVTFPVQFLIAEFPILIESDNPHVIRGAALVADYLVDNNNPKAPGAHNLQASAHNLEALVGNDHPPLKRLPATAERLLTPSLEKTCRGLALISLAQFNVSANEECDEDITSDLMERGRKHLGFFGRFITTHGMVRPFYENVLNKDNPTEKELRAASAARRYTKKHSISMRLLFINNVSNSRKEKNLYEKLGLTK